MLRLLKSKKIFQSINAKVATLKSLRIVTLIYFSTSDVRSVHTVYVSLVTVSYQKRISASVLSLSVNVVLTVVVILKSVTIDRCH